MPPRRSARWWRFQTPPAGLSVILMVMLLIATVLCPYVVISVPSGQVGVLWNRINGFDPYCWCFVGRGTVLDPRDLREEGLHIIGLGTSCTFTICGCNPRRRHTTPSPRTA